MSKEQIVKNFRYVKHPFPDNYAKIVIKIFSIISIFRTLLPNYEI